MPAIDVYDVILGGILGAVGKTFLDFIVSILSDKLSRRGEHKQKQLDWYTSTLRVVKRASDPPIPEVEKEYLNKDDFKQFQGSLYQLAEALDDQEAKAPSGIDKEVLSDIKELSRKCRKVERLNYDDKDERNQYYETATDIIDLGEQIEREIESKIENRRLVNWL